MTEVISLLRHGWKSIWKQNSIWIFSALSVLPLAIRPFQANLDGNSLLILLFLAVSLISLPLYLVSIIAVPYLAYCSSIGMPATFRETLFAVRRFATRVIACSCLGVLIFLPCFLLAYFIVTKDSTDSRHANSILFLLFLPLSALSALWDFTLAGLFANNWGVQQSMSNAWGLFVNHLNTLAALGIVLAVVFRLLSTASAILAILVQSGFDFSSLGKLDYFNPTMSLGGDLLFGILSGAGQIIYTVFSASVFIPAYIRYSGVRAG